MSTDRHEFTAKFDQRRWEHSCLFYLWITWIWQQQNVYLFWWSENWEWHTGYIIRLPWDCTRGQLESEIRRERRRCLERTLRRLLKEWRPSSLLLQWREASPWILATSHVPHVWVWWCWRGCLAILLRVVLLHLIVKGLHIRFQTLFQSVPRMES